MNGWWTKTYVGQGLDCCFIKFDIVELDMFCQLDERRRCIEKRGENWVQSQNCLWLVAKLGHTKVLVAPMVTNEESRAEVRIYHLHAGELTPRLGVLFIQGRSVTHPDNKAFHRHRH